MSALAEITVEISHDFQHDSSAPRYAGHVNLGEQLRKYTLDAHGCLTGSFPGTGIQAHVVCTADEGREGLSQNLRRDTSN